MHAAATFDWRHVSQDYAKLYEAATGGAVRTVLDVPVQVQTLAEAVKLVDARYELREGTAIAFANAHTLNVAAENPAFRLALQNALVFNDGLGVDIASRILYGSPFPENLNGTDFVPNYLRRTKHRYRIFLLGAKPGIAERAAHRLSVLCPGHKVVGCRNGHFDRDQASEIADLIRRSKADLLLVAMGNPKAGAVYPRASRRDWLSFSASASALCSTSWQATCRAPRSWVQRWRLEWVYRLLQEPRRLAGRYLAGNPRFLMRILSQWWSGSRVKTAGPIVVEGAAAARPRRDKAIARDSGARKAA